MGAALTQPFIIFFFAWESANALELASFPTIEPTLTIINFVSKAFCMISAFQYHLPMSLYMKTAISLCWIEKRATEFFI